MTEKCFKEGALLPSKQTNEWTRKNSILEAIEQAREGYLGEVSVQGWVEFWNAEVEREGRMAPTRKQRRQVNQQTWQGAQNNVHSAMGVTGNKTRP